MKSYEEIIIDLKTGLETLNPDVLSSYACQLSMHMAFIGEQYAKAEIEYNKIWEVIRMKCDTDGRADKKSKGTQEYYQKKMLEVQLSSTKELINAIKRRLGVLSDEMKMANG